MAPLSPECQSAFAAYLMAAKRLTQEVGRRMDSEAGMSFEEYDVLVTLEYAEGHRLRMSDLADRALLSRSGMTRLVDRLERRGWVARIPCPQDRRASHCQLTDAGQAAREAAWPTLRQAIQELFAEAVGDDAKALEAISRRIAEQKVEA